MVVPGGGGGVNQTQREIWGQTREKNRFNTGPMTSNGSKLSCLNDHGRQKGVIQNHVEGKKMETK